MLSVRERSSKMNEMKSIIELQLAVSCPASWTCRYTVGETKWQKVMNAQVVAKTRFSRTQRTGCNVLIVGQKCQSRTSQAPERRACQQKRGTSAIRHLGQLFGPVRSLTLAPSAKRTCIWIGDACSIGVGLDATAGDLVFRRQMH